MRNKQRTPDTVEGWKQITDGRDFFLLQGREGVIIVKTNQAILVAHYPESVQPGPAANTVEQLADYLVGVGY